MLRRLFTMLAVLAALGAAVPARAATPSVFHVARQWGGGMFSDGMLTVYPTDYYSATSGYRVAYFDHQGCTVYADVPTGAWIVDPSLSYARLDMATPCGRLHAVFRGFGDYYPDTYAGTAGAMVFIGREARFVVTVAGVETGRAAAAAIRGDFAAVVTP
jgi:hypothetical protein